MYEKILVKFYIIKKIINMSVNLNIFRIGEIFSFIKT